MKRVAISFIIIVFVCIATAYIPGIPTRIVQRVAERFLSADNLTTTVGSVRLVDNSILLRDIRTSYDNKELTTIESITINYDVVRSLKKLALIFNIELSNLSIEGLKFSLGGNIAYAASYLKASDLNVTADSGGDMKISAFYKTRFGSPYHLSVNATANHIPLMLHKAFWNVFPNNGVVEFLRDFILAGEVSGDVSLRLDKDAFARNKIKDSDMSGVFVLQDVDLKYDEYFPVLKNINADVMLTGNNLGFTITQGRSGGIMLHDGTVTLNLDKGLDNSVMIKTKAKGPLVDMVSFIPESSLEKLKKSKIDMTKVVGNIVIDLGIQIPLRPDVPNQYDVRAEIDNMRLKILDENVVLSQGRLQGIFNGAIIAFDGTGKVNDYTSNIHYKMHFDPKEEFDHVLNIQMQLVPLLGRKNEALSILQGRAIANINYTLKDQNSIFSIDSNLQKIEFVADKLGIHKPLGAKAILKIEGHAQDTAPSRLDIKLTGADGMKIKGVMDIADKKQRLHFSEIKYMDTDIKADLIFGDHALKATIEGNQIDLSKTNLMRYLDKDADGRNTDLNVNLSKIKLQNGILLDNFVMRIKCDTSKCYEGMMDSSVGSKSLRMTLHDKDDTEEWKITTTNAGAILSAFGLYDKVRAGNLVLVVNTSRREVTAGNPITVTQGRFELKKFVTVGASFLTRMVSFISLPGLLRAVTDNKNISFSIFDGTFDYKDGVISITDASAEGSFFNFTMNGSIDTKTRMVKLKGGVMPSLYGISSLVGNIPVLGSIMSGGRRKGLIFAPYTIKQGY